MPKIDEQISYNWLFFLLAGAFGAVSLWAAYDEAFTRREWKVYQDRFFQIERQLAKDGLATAKKARDENKEYAKLVAEKAAIEQRRKTRAAEITRVAAELEDAKFAFEEGQQQYTFTKSELDEVYYDLTLAKHERNESHLATVQKRYSELESRLKKDDLSRAEKEKKYNELAKKHAELLDVEAYAKVLEQLEKLEKDVAEGDRKLETAEGKSPEIIQQDLAEMNRVDRCESCHVGSTRGGFETVTPKYFATHPYRRTLMKSHPPEQFGCTTCHDGQGRATTKFHAHAPSKDEDTHAFHKHYWEEPLLKGPYVESNCRKCHVSETNLRSQIQCEINAECPKGLTCAVPSQWTPGAGMPLPEMVAAGAEPVAKKDEVKLCVNDEGRAPLVDLAPHLSRGKRIIEEVGCFGCHPMEGFDLPKVGPDLRHAKDKLDPAWISEWIKNPKGIRPTTRMPNFFPEQLHPEEYPKTAVPQFDDKSKDPEHPERWRPDQQIAAMVSFLYANSTPYEAKVSRLPVTGNPENGKELIGSVGCMGCHTFTGFAKQVDHKNRASHFDHGPDLSDVGSKTSVEWLFSWLKDPRSYNPNSRMPNLRLTDQEAADIATYLVAQKSKNKAGAERKFVAVAGVDPQNQGMVEGGKKLLKHYGCYGCHAVGGFETLAGIGVELTEFGTKGVETLDFGDYIVNHNMQTWERWLYHKLRHPRVYRYERVDTRMPQFDLTDDEITDVMVVLKGMRGKQRDATAMGNHLTGIEAMREEGRRLVRWYNCFGCHPMDNFQPDIRQIYPADQLSFAPPDINGEGFKAQPNWLFSFLKNVVPLRPWLSVRMPTFGFNDTEASHLVAMFSAIDKAEWPFRYYDIDLKGSRREIASKLFDELRCQQCHVLGDGEIPADKVASAAPNLLLTKTRLRAEWISKWIENPEMLMPGTKMPAFFSGGLNALDAIMNNPAGKEKFAHIPGVDEIRKGGARAQIDLLRDYLMTLHGAPAVAESSNPPPVKAKKKAQRAVPRRRAEAPRNSSVQ